MIGTAMTLLLWAMKSADASITSMALWRLFLPQQINKRNTMDMIEKVINKRR
jgi:hypothetical protein